MLLEWTPIFPRMSIQSIAVGNLWINNCCIRVSVMPLLYKCKPYFPFLLFWIYTNDNQTLIKMSTLQLSVLIFHFFLVPKTWLSAFPIFDSKNVIFETLNWSMYRKKFWIVYHWKLFVFLCFFFSSFPSARQYFYTGIVESYLQPLY